MSKPFLAPNAKGKPSRTVEAVDVAARHLVYKLCEAADGVQGRGTRWVRRGAAPRHCLRDLRATNRYLMPNAGLIANCLWTLFG
jgi:hypothetical protein